MGRIYTPHEDASPHMAIHDLSDLHTSPVPTSLQAGSTGGLRICMTHIAERAAISQLVQLSAYLRALF